MTHECEFGVVKEPCYFCKQEKTVGFSEHYTFCPNCSAIYTKMSVAKGCSHLLSGYSAVFTSRTPWYKSVRESVLPYVTQENHCSACGALIIDGGW